MKTENEYIESLVAELKEWGAQIDFLTLKVKDAASQDQQKYLEEVQFLHVKQSIIVKQIQKLNDASNDIWEASKQTFDKNVTYAL
jgi:hypothetical protein